MTDDEDGTDEQAASVDDPSDPYGEFRQTEVFLNGRAGIDPDYPISVADLREQAREALDPDAEAYLFGGAGREDTVRENRDAFADYRLVPRMLRDVSDRGLSVSVLDSDLPVPFLLAPIGMQSLFHEDAELATARACADLDVPMVLSSVASETPEDVAEKLGDTTGWFQLYWNADPAVAESFLARAENAGYEALVVTVDTPFTGWRERELQQASLPFFDGHGLATYFSDPAFREALDSPPEENEAAAVQHLLDGFSDASRTWADLADLLDGTDLPALVKGVLRPDDARHAVEAGAEGVIVSNHGGRQVDGEIAALDALPGVADEIGDEAAVLFDSGIRGGADALRALALGADAVLLGRPYIYGLAVGGEAGVKSAVENFRADLDLTLGLLGYADVTELDRDVVIEK
jgi:isopentenyl-diphosphate delta-isomerase